MVRIDYQFPVLGNKTMGFLAHTLDHGIAPIYIFGPKIQNLWYDYGFLENNKVLLRFSHGKNEIETVWSQNNIILRLVPPIQTHFLNQNLWEWEKYPNLAPRLGNSGPKFLGLGWARVNFGDLIPVMPIWKCWDNL